MVLTQRELNKHPYYSASFHPSHGCTSLVSNSCVQETIVTLCLLKSGAPNNVIGSGLLFLSFLFSKAAYRIDFSPSAVTILPLGFAASIWKAYRHFYKDLRATDFLKSRLFKTIPIWPNCSFWGHDCLGTQYSLSFTANFISYHLLLFASGFPFLYCFFLLITDNNT